MHAVHQNAPCQLTSLPHLLISSDIKKGAGPTLFNFRVLSYDPSFAGLKATKNPHKYTIKSMSTLEHICVVNVGQIGDAEGRSSITDT